MRESLLRPAVLNKSSWGCILFVVITCRLFFSLGSLFTDSLCLSHSLSVSVSPAERSSESWMKTSIRGWI
jgi:hypothetical protein